MPDGVVLAGFALVFIEANFFKTPCLIAQLPFSCGGKSSIYPNKKPLSKKRFAWI